MFGTLGLGLCLGFRVRVRFRVRISVRVIVRVNSFRDSFSVLLRTHSIDPQRAIITVPARSPSATKTLVKYVLRQQLARLGL